MPPKAASRGGKRGRPPNASKAENASRAQAPTEPELPQDLNDELSFEDQSTPKNGVVPPSKEAGAAVVGRNVRRRRSPAHQDNEPTPRRAGRASSPPEGSARDDELADQTADTPASASRGQRRSGLVGGGMDSAAGEDDTSQTQDASATAANSKRKRGRPPKAARTDTPGESTAMDTTEQTQKRKRGRPSLHPKAVEGTPLSESASHGNKGKRKASAIEQDEAAEDETVPVTKKPRGRPKSAVPAEPTPEPRRRGRPRLSEASASNATQKPSSSTKAPRSKAPPASAESQKKRRRTDVQSAPARNTLAGPPPPEPAEEEDDRPPSPVRNYRHIGAKPTSIPLATIHETWSPLPPQSISLATSLLRFAERPVLQSLSTNIKRRDHAAFVLRKVCHTISRRLTRQFPFPPALGAGAGPRRQHQQQPARDPRDAELDYEHVLSTVKSLQGSLDTLLHANALLSSERDREEALLEKEYAELDTLEANARSEVRGLREKLRKAHPLVPDPAPPQQRQHGFKEDTVDSRLPKEEQFASPLFGDFAQVGLAGLDAQLANHMDSLKANLGQVEGVVPQVMQSRAALRNVLARYLAPGHLEEVILG